MKPVLTAIFVAGTLGVQVFGRCAANEGGHHDTRPDQGCQGGVHSRKRCGRSSRGGSVLPLP